MNRSRCFLFVHFSIRKCDSVRHLTISIALEFRGIDMKMRRNMHVDVGGGYSFFSLTRCKCSLFGIHGTAHNIVWNSATFGNA